MADESKPRRRRRRRRGAAFFHIHLARQKDQDMYNQFFISCPYVFAGAGGGEEGQLIGGALKLLVFA